jgi:hypothetical protein
MKFKLPRQILTLELKKIVSREMRKQKLNVPKLSRRELRELAYVCRTIEKAGLPDFFVCKPLGKNLGHGIFLHPSAAPLKKGSVIAAYSGELSLIPKYRPDDGSYAFTPVEDMRLSREEQRSYDASSSYRPNKLYCLKVDALRKGNFTRYINHSEKPNVIAYTLAVPPNRFGLAAGPIEVIYFVKKEIQPGEQLLVCYEEGEKCYWNAQSVKPFVMTPKTFRLTASGIVFSK